jgi:signal transduction histidine kinase/ActR/RegA family two-component response regulator
MTTPKTQQDTRVHERHSVSFLAGGGVSGALMRSLDWAATAVGAPETWPHSLRTMVGTLLHSRHPMFLWWGPELIQFYNDAYLPSFGAGKHPAAMGQRGRECWAEIWPIIGPQIDDVMQRGKSSWNEDQLVPILRNGRMEEVYWTYGYSPVYDETGEVGGTLVVCTEITSRVLAERRLGTLRKLVESTRLGAGSSEVLANARDALTLGDKDTPFVLVYQWDPRTGDFVLLESCGPETSSRKRFDTLAKAALTREQRALSTADTQSRGAPSRGQLLALPETSETAFLTPMLSSSGGVVGYALFGLSTQLPFDERYRDYLAQLAAHLGLALAEAEALEATRATAAERNNLLLQAPIATALLTGPTHRFELVNAKFQTIVGRDVLGKTYREAFPEHVGMGLPELLDDVYHTGTPFVTEELLVPLRVEDSGLPEERFFKFNLEPLRNARRQVYGMMTVAMDITDHVRARLRLEQADLERSKLLSDLEAANRAKDEFLAMLGHELRNPLSPIVTALQLMKLQDNGIMQRERTVIERHVHHMIRLVDDLLDVSKITRGKIELRRSRVDVASVLTRAVEMASLLLEQRQHLLTVDIETRGLLWEGDPDRLAQVVSNLLTNAARYTEPGGKIRLSAQLQGDQIVIAVQDNGIGISADMLPTIFDMFVQGGRSADRAEGGLGLGLALVRSLVKMHGGSVQALSEGINMGSTFTVRLPMPAQELAAVDTPLALRVEPRPMLGQRVLLVDDNVDAAELLGEWLRRLGHEVEIAHDPISALEVAPQYQPDVALLDIGLPVMDGYELGERLRKIPGLTQCELIAVTGYGQTHDQQRSKLLGFAHHLVKPVNMVELSRILGDVRQPTPASAH